ncbi:MAG: ABC transporter ATP-binding protein [Candidatus Eremiobacterota bacterium]
MSSPGPLGQPVLEVTGLTRSTFQRGTSISFSLYPGQVLGVIGPNDSGKTEILKALAGIVRPHGGTITLRGKPVGPATRARVGYVPASPGVYEEFTGSEYLEFFAEAFGMDVHYRPYLVREVLRLVRLTPYADKMVRDLNYALRRRLSLARAIIHNPSLVVVDDCLVRLERGEAREMVAVLSEIRAQGKALVASSPQLSDLASLCSHLCILVTNRPLACGEIRALMQQVTHYRMMQVQFLSGLAEAVRLLESYPGVFHLAVSTQTHNLVRFLFNGNDDAFQKLLDELNLNNISVVSYAEDHSFLGRPASP